MKCGPSNRPEGSEIYIQRGTMYSKSCFLMFRSGENVYIRQYLKVDIFKDHNSPLVFFLPELIWNYGSYRQLVVVIGRATSPVVRPLPTQVDTTIEGTRRDKYASSEIRT
jgi:hypothetical protein